MYKVAIKKRWAKPGEKIPAKGAKGRIDYKVVYRVNYWWEDSLSVKRRTDVDFYVCDRETFVNSDRPAARFVVIRTFKWPNILLLQNQAQLCEVMRRIDKDKTFIKTCGYNDLTGKEYADSFVAHMLEYEDELKKLDGGLRSVAAAAKVM